MMRNNILQQVQAEFEQRRMANEYEQRRRRQQVEREHPDLADALDDGVIAGAGIDVFDKEPPLDLDEPLINCCNTIVTPHVAFATEESMLLRAQIVFDNLAAWMKGQPKNVMA